MAGDVCVWVSLGALGLLFTLYAIGCAKNLHETRRR